MVHVTKCPLKYRGKPALESVTGYIYCAGFMDLQTEEPVNECACCLDWYGGEQALKDFAAYMAKIDPGECV